MKDMDTIDASNLKTDFMGHLYFGDSGTVWRICSILFGSGSDPQSDSPLSLYYQPAEITGDVSGKA